MSMWPIDHFQLCDFILIVRSGSNKGIDMARIPSIFASQGEEVWKLYKEKWNKWFLWSVGLS